MKSINPKVLKFFETLADETRLQILIAISKGALTVKEIHEKVDNISLSAISHQLKTMSDMDIVEIEKKGRKKYVSLSKNYCWCILNDAFSKFKTKHKCERCANITEEGGIRT